MGVYRSVSDPFSVAQIGRASEKWRFRTEDALCARRSALDIPFPKFHSGEICDLLDPGIDAFSDAQIIALDPQLSVDVASFDEVPRSVL